jgi:hypothetical protein
LFVPPRTESISGRGIDDARLLNAYEVFRAINVLYASAVLDDDAHPFLAHEFVGAIRIYQAFRCFGHRADAFRTREIPKAVRVLCTYIPFVAKGLACSDFIEELNFSARTHILSEQLGKEFLGIDVGGQPVGHHGDENAPDVLLEFGHKRWTLVCKGYGLVAFHAEGLTVLETKPAMVSPLEFLVGTCQGRFGNSAAAYGAHADDQQRCTDELSLHCYPSLFGC